VEEGGRLAWLFTLVSLVAVSFAAGYSCARGTRGEERARCYRNNTCNKGLVCASEICVKPPLPDAGAP